jgi:hypothetical protein
MYNKGCRCEDCKKFKAAKSKRLRKNKKGRTTELESCSRL